MTTRSILTICLFVVFGAGTSAALAGPGPGGNLEIQPGSTLQDTNTNQTYTIGLRAVENGSVAGLGDVVYELVGPSISVCSIHGSSASVDFTDVGNEGGVSPGFECGRSFGETVSVDDCKAHIQAHSFSHTDHPLINYLGPVTADIDFRKRNGTSGDLDITVHTAAGKITIKGRVTGTITMSTCP